MQEVDAFGRQIRTGDLIGYARGSGMRCELVPGIYCGLHLTKRGTVNKRLPYLIFTEHSRAYRASKLCIHAVQFNKRIVKLDSKLTESITDMLERWEKTDERSCDGTVGTQT